MSLFGRALLETGVGNEDFVRLSQRIGRSTGGIRPLRWTSAVPGRADCAAWFNLRGKALPEQTGEMLSILRDILTRARLDNRERFQQLALEEKAAVESRLVPGGSGYVDGRLRANFYESDWADEQMGGISYLFFLRKLVDDIETGWDGIHAALERIRATLLDRSVMLCNVTADAADWHRIEPQLGEFLAALPRGTAKRAPWHVADTPRAEGLVIPAKVNYVGKGADLYRVGVKPNGSHIVARRYLRTSYLWDKIRVQGGAYGGHCMFDRFSGGFTFVSYRDPNLLASLNVYDRTGDFLRNASLDHAELTRNIIGTIGEVDSYRLPDAKGFASMQRYLIGDTDENRQRMREEILGDDGHGPAPFRRRHGRSGRERPGRRARLRAGDHGRQQGAARVPHRLSRSVRRRLSVPGLERLVTKAMINDLSCWMRSLNAFTGFRGLRMASQSDGSQCSLTCGSVRRVKKRATVSKPTFTGPCSAVSCIL